MDWQSKAPKFGDVIRTKVEFYYHYGIFADETRVIQFGLPDNVNRPAGEVEVISTDIYTFLSGGEIEVLIPDRKERRKMRSPKERVKLAESCLGEDGYDVFNNNCEHFVKRCLFKE